MPLPPDLQNFVRLQRKPIRWETNTSRGTENVTVNVSAAKQWAPNQVRAFALQFIESEIAEQERLQPPNVATDILFDGGRRRNLAQLRRRIDVLFGGDAGQAAGTVDVRPLMDVVARTVDIVVRRSLSLAFRADGRRLSAYNRKMRAAVSTLRWQWILLRRGPGSVTDLSPRTLNSRDPVFMVLGDRIAYVPRPANAEEALVYGALFHAFRQGRPRTKGGRLSFQASTFARASAAANRRVRPFARVLAGWSGNRGRSPQIGRRAGPGRGYRIRGRLTNEPSKFTGQSVYTQGIPLFIFSRNVDRGRQRERRQ